MFIISSHNSRRISNGSGIINKFQYFFSLEPEESLTADLKDEGDHLILEVELHGAKRDDVHISLNDGELTISAIWNREKHGANSDKRYLINERTYGSGTRRFLLEDIAEDQITAEFADGILTLILPKNTFDEEPPRKIEIKTAPRD